MATPFLTARWQELTLLNYDLAPDFLRSFLPTGLEPDLLDGRAYCSLVAFDFEKIRVAGIPWPGYTRFPEFNLRVYVRCQEKGRRGVLFIRELIPAALPCWIARMAYNEPYSPCPMERRHTQHDDGSLIQRTEWLWEKQWNLLQVSVGARAYLPAEGSREDWFKEQEWGFGLDRRGALLRYRVTHPRWLLREINDWDLEMNWSALYGPLWAETLQDREPTSIVHAIGSEIAVYPPQETYRPHFH